MGTGYSVRVQMISIYSKYVVLLYYHQLIPLDESNNWF